MSQIEMVVFANSIKYGQHCVAGKLVNSSRWIRPVSTEQGGEISHDQARCHNPHGSFRLRPLQKIRIGLSRHVPLINQPENYLIDHTPWQQNFRISEDELAGYLDTPETLWGLGDRVPYERIQRGEVTVTQSLYLVAVDHLSLYLNSFGKRRAAFSYRGNAYDLAVTDPAFDFIVRDRKPLRGIICVSLGSVYEGACYKLAATLL